MKQSILLFPDKMIVYIDKLEKYLDKLLVFLRFSKMQDIFKYNIKSTIFLYTRKNTMLSLKDLNNIKCQVSRNKQKMQKALLRKL